MSYNEQMTSQNALANAKLLFKALASREANLDEPIPDDRILDVAAQIGLEGDDFDSAVDYAADQGWFEDAEVNVTPVGFRSRPLVWPPRNPNYNTFRSLSRYNPDLLTISGPV